VKTFGEKVGNYADGQGFQTDKEIQQNNLAAAVADLEDNFSTDKRAVTNEKLDYVKALAAELGVDPSVIVADIKSKQGAIDNEWADRVQAKKEASIINLKSLDIANMNDQNDSLKAVEWQNSTQGKVVIALANGVDKILTATSSSANAAELPGNPIANMALKTLKQDLNSFKSLIAVGMTGAGFPMDINQRNTIARNSCNISTFYIMMNSLGSNDSYSSYLTKGLNSGNISPKGGIMNYEDLASENGFNYSKVDELSSIQEKPVYNKKGQWIDNKKIFDESINNKMSDYVKSESYILAEMAKRNTAVVGIRLAQPNNHNIGHTVTGYLQNGKLMIADTGRTWGYKNGQNTYANVRNYWAKDRNDKQYTSIGSIFFLKKK